MADHPVGEVAVMCGSGVPACHGLFALELAGKPLEIVVVDDFSSDGTATC